MWDFVLLKNDSRLVSGSSDAELRVWALHFTDEVEKGTETEDNSVKKDRTEEPPNKMFRLDTEGETKPEPQKEDDDGVKDDAVSK